MKFFLVLLLTILAFTSSASAASNLECEFCDFVVNYIENTFKNNQSESIIITEVEKICNFIPGNLQSTCDTLVSAYLPEVLSFISEKEPASVICSKINLCANSTVVAKPVEKVGGAVGCELCEFAVKNIETYLGQNSTETQILTFLDNDCKIFGGLASMCQTMVNQYAPLLIQKLEQKENPATVCSQVSLCSNSTCKYNIKTEGDVDCQICSFLVKDVEQFLELNQTESQIIDGLDAACNTIPIVGSICTGIVNEYAPQIIQLLVNKENPATVCSQIGFCQSSSQSSQSENSGSASQSSQSSGNSFSGQSSGFSSGQTFRINVQ